MALIVDSAGTRTYTPVLQESPPKQQDPPQPDPQPSGEGKPASGDAASANTQKQIAEAQAAERAVADLAKASGKNGESPETAKMLKERKEFAAKQWAEVKQAIEYELRLAAGGDPKKLAERQQQAKSYDAGNPEYQKMVDEAAKRIQAQSPAERNTDIQRYELQQARETLAGLKSGPRGAHTPSELMAAESAVRQQEGELRTAIDREIDEHFKTLGQAVNYMPDAYKSVADRIAGRFDDPDMQNAVRAAVIGREVEGAKSLGIEAQLKILDKRLKDAPPELAKAVHADARVTDIANQAAKQIADAYQLRGVKEPKNQWEAYTRSGAAEAAKLLRSYTDLASPQMAGRILEASRPTIDKIAGDILDGAQISVAAGQRAGRPTGNQMGFQSALLDLAAATTRAAQDPANRAAVTQVADSLVREIPGGKLGLFDETLGTSVRQLNPDLAIAVVERLKAAGRTAEANEVAGKLVQGLGDIGQTATKSIDAYNKAHLEKLFLEGSFRWLGDPRNQTQQQAVEQFWKTYEAKHPDRKSTELDIDRVGDGILRTIETFGAKQDVFKGLKAEGEFKNTLDRVPTDSKALEAMLLSKSAQLRLAQGLESGGDHSVISQLSADNMPREARTLSFRAAMTYVGQQMAVASKALDTAKQIEAGSASPASKALANQQYAAAEAAVEKLRGHATLLGFSGDRRANFDKMIDSFHKMIQADRSGNMKDLGAAIKAFEAAAEDPRNGVSLYPTTVTGLSMRLAGLALAYPIVARQLGAIGEGTADAGTMAQAVLNSGLFGQQSLFVLGGLGRLGAQGTAALITKVSNEPNPALAAKLLMGDDWIAKGLTRLSHTAEPIAMAGAIVEGIVSLGYIGEDNGMALLHGMNAAGNASVALGYANATGRWPLITGRLPIGATPWMIGVGAAVVTATALGIYAYGKAKDASQFETETTTEYLKLLGVDPQVAHHLRDQDDEGRSAGPVLAELATRSGLDLSDPRDTQRFIRYLNDLGPDKVAKLVEQAHGVDPNAQGRYPQTDAANDKYLLLPIDPKKFLSTPEGRESGSKIFYNSEKQRWEDPVTRMVYNEASKTWTYEGPIDTTPGKETPVHYDPATRTLTLSGNTYRYAEVHSMEGLRNWLLTQGYPLPG